MVKRIIEWRYILLAVAIGTMSPTSYAEMHITNHGIPKNMIPPHSSSVSGFWKVDGSQQKTLPSIGKIDFHKIYSTYHMYDDGSWASEIDNLNQWAQTIVSKNPFGLPGSTVPWTDLSKYGSFVTVTLKQLAYIGITVLHSPNGSGDTPFQNSLSGMIYYSVMAFLLGIKDNPNIDSINVAASQGGWSPQDAQSKLPASWQSTPVDSKLNVCNFDNSSIIINSDTHPLDSKYCHTDSTTNIGHDYMSDDIPGEAVIDILGGFYSGGDNCTGCSIANTQDESMAVFYPETTILSFFSANNNHQNKIFVSRTITFLGVRKYLDKQSGSNIFTHTCGSVGKSKSTLLEATVSAGDLTFYDHSLVGLASCCCACISPYVPNRRDSCTGGSGAGTPVHDIFTWFGAFNPDAYDPFISPIVKSVIRRVGTGPWGAGAWAGDTQQYFLIIWAGTILNQGLTLDYFIYKSYCERRFEGCGLYGGSTCNECWSGTNPPKRCGRNGITDIVQKFTTVGAIYQALLRTQQLQGAAQIFDNI